jgi:LCP family protein required for cell wall assembly
MKKALKIIVIVILTLVLIAMGIWHFYLKHKTANEAKTVAPTDDFEYTAPVEVNDEENKEEFIQINKVEVKTYEQVLKEKLNGLVELSERVNVVIFSHDGVRADTIIYVSFNPESKKLDIINIHRDTFWRVEGYTSDIGNQKINAVYGRGNGLGGSKGVKQAIADLLQVPVHYFIKFSYNGAAAVIYSIGGVEVTVEKDLKYDDEWAEPPLHIDIKAGTQVLDGETSVEYLRWRKNNGEDGTGDLPRIRRMQDFARKVVKKAVGPNFPSFVKSWINYVYTDLEMDLAVSYAVKSIGIENADIEFTTLPGGVIGDYYVCDIETTQKLLIDIYEK